MAVQSSFFRLITNYAMDPKSISPRRSSRPINQKYIPATFRKRRENK